MCGVAGLLMTADRGLDAPAAVRRMTNRMAPRGPDAEGFWSDPAAGLYFGHRRLSIIDPGARSDQPMVSPGGRCVIVFNGEIYNYRALRGELEAGGVVFATRSDTEVIAALYERHGTVAFERLRGMFAVAIWDRARRELALARDPYGIKPLYVARAGGALGFASQVKALIASGLVSAEPSAAGLAGFHIWGSVPEPFTFYRAIAAVPAGGWMTIGADGREAAGSHAAIAEAWSAPAPRLAPHEIEVLVRSAVADAVAAHLVADVPIAAFLSGGVDSGAIAGHVAEQRGGLEGVTVAFAEFDGRPENESDQAARTAQHYGLRHTVRRVGLEEFRADLPWLIEAMDQPSIDGVNTWFAAKAVAERGYKVALSGVGGDELFRGYPSFDRVPRLAQAGRLLRALGPARGLAGPPLGVLSALARQPKLSSLATLSGGLANAYRLQRGLFAPADLPALLGSALARDGLEALDEAAAGAQPPPPLEPAQAVGVLESSCYLRNQLLRDADWASMAHSIELRTPLVDIELARRLAPHGAAFAAGRGKRLLGRSPRPVLPAAFVEQSKLGFSIPMGRWLAAPERRRAGAEGDLGRGWARRWALRLAAEFGGGTPAVREV